MSEYLRRPNENIKDYKIRLFQNKDLYELTTQQIADLLNKETGEKFNESTYRKWYRAYAEGLEDGKVHSLSDDNIIKEYELKRIEFEKEKMRFYDQRTAYNKDIRNEARFDELKDVLKNSINNLRPYEPYVVPYLDDDKNDLLISLNDIHYGIEIHNYWNNYNSEIAKLRLEKYLEHIVDIKNLHKSQNCYVCANGDLISGNIHYGIAVANRENVIQQIMGVSELISWFLNMLSAHFNHVYFSALPGNHSRLSTKDDSLKDERLDLLIPWYIKSRLQNISSISVLDSNIDSTMNVVDIRGKKYLNVHGDMDNVHSVLKLVEMLPYKVYAIHMAHLHHNATDFIQGYKIILAGSLMGIDDFCIQKRIFGQPQQSVSVCDYSGVKCTYDVNF